MLNGKINLYVRMIKVVEEYTTNVELYTSDTVIPSVEENSSTGESESTILKPKIAVVRLYNVQIRTFKFLWFEIWKTVYYAGTIKEVTEFINSLIKDNINIILK